MVPDMLPYTFLADFQYFMQQTQYACPIPGFVKSPYQKSSIPHSILKSGTDMVLAPGNLSFDLKPRDVVLRFKKKIFKNPFVLNFYLKNVVTSFCFRVVCNYI